MKSFKYLAVFLISFLIPALLWSVVLFFLPRYPLINPLPSVKKEYYPLNLVKIFTSGGGAKRVYVSSTLKGVYLKGVYLSKKDKFVILQKGKKSYFVNLGERFEGYKLIKITPKSAVFKRGDREYKVEFKPIKPLLNTSKSSSFERIEVSRERIEAVKRNFTKVWREIGVVKSKEGYKITFVKKGSFFDKIGLKRGDILLEVNGIPLNSEKNAWEAYKKLQNQHSITLSVKRNSKIKVIEYEIY